MLLLSLLPVVSLTGCLGLNSARPVIPNRERPHTIAKGVVISVWMAQGTDATGQVQYVAQDFFVPPGFVLFAPELIYPPPPSGAKP